jgi:hypothetical protein
MVPCRRVFNSTTGATTQTRAAPGVWIACTANVSTPNTLNRSHRASMHDADAESPPITLERRTARRTTRTTATTSMSIPSGEETAASARVNAASDGEGSAL